LTPLFLLVAGQRVEGCQRTGHCPKTLFDSLTRSAAQHRHSDTFTLEKPGQSRSAGSRACHVAPAPIRGHWRASHVLLARIQRRTSPTPKQLRHLRIRIHCKSSVRRDIRRHSAKCRARDSILSRRLNVVGQRNGCERTWNVDSLDGSRTQESAANQSCRGPSLGRVHEWTDARKRPSKLPFLPFFSTLCAATRCQGSTRTSLLAKQIGHVTGVPGRSGSLVGIGASKLPRRFPPRVHYLKLKSRSQISLPREGAAVI
jgi:hypothetical protein